MPLLHRQTDVMRRLGLARPSMHIADRAVANIISASKFAIQIGMPLNSFRTIHLGAAGLSDHDALAAFGHWKHLVTQWMFSAGTPIALIWVRENGLGEGHHVHMLMHIPIDLKLGFRDHQRRWLKLCGGRNGRGVFDARSVGCNLGLAFGDQYALCRYRRNLANVLAYMLKGADPQTLAEYGLATGRAEGRISGKRCGTSENIGATARGIRWSQADLIDFLDALKCAL